MKKWSSHTRNLRWIPILLVVVLADPVSSSASSSQLKFRAGSSHISDVFYLMEVTVDVMGEKKDESDIENWIAGALKEHLGSCVSPSTDATIEAEARRGRSVRTAALADNNGVMQTLFVTEGGVEQWKEPIRPNKDRIVREVDPSTVSKATKIFQAIEATCVEKTNIRQTECTVLVQLRQSVTPCCILRTLCSASKASSGISVVGREAYKASSLTTRCGSHRPDSCSYRGPTGPSCSESSTAYVANSTNCGAGNTCSCSTYCNNTDAYYTLQVSAPTASKLSSTLEGGICSSSPRASCAISGEYSGYNVTCGHTEEPFRVCTVLLGFTRAVPICNLSAVVTALFGSHKEYKFDGLVRRAAICGNAKEPLHSKSTLLNNDLKPATVCNGEFKSFPCGHEETVVIELQEHCTWAAPTAATPSTTNTTTTSPSVNTTSSPLNTTATSPNVTVTTNPNTTTSANATTPAANVTANATTSTTGSAIDLSGNASGMTSSEVDDLVNELEGLLSGPTISQELAIKAMGVVSHLQSASPEALANSASRIIGIGDTVGKKVILNTVGQRTSLDRETFTILTPTVALSVKPVDGANLQESVFSITGPDNVQVSGSARLSRSWRADSSDPQGSVTLPSTLGQNLTNEEVQLLTRVQFMFYQKSILFQDKSMGNRTLNSGILGASAANMSISGLDDHIVITLKTLGPIPENLEAYCVFWDFTFNNASGGWNTDGCSVLNSTDNETICGCNHLTNFGVLLDISRGGITDRVQATILTFITYIGCGISAIFLAFTILTYLAFEKIRKDIPSKILIQLCMALLLLNLVFLVDAWLALYPDAVGLCISTAWFLHYFLLVSFTWMGLEAVHMYVALVKVFNSYMSHYMLKLSLAGWGIPMIVVIIVIAVDKDNYGLISYGKFPDGSTDDFCWLKSDIAFYVAVVAYFCAIFLFNLTMFIVVLVQLYRIKRQNPHNMQHRTTFQDVRSVAGITILLGLTWGFAFFAWGPVNLAFMYLFAIFNSFQGLFIFVFHCVWKENVRRQWRVYLCCGKMRLAENSDWSRTATQKTMKKSSVSRLTSLPSSRSFQSNNSSSSSSFLVHDVSDQFSGTASPFEDRTITADENPNLDVVLNEINMQYQHPHAS